MQLVGRVLGTWFEVVFVSVAYMDATTICVSCIRFVYGYGRFEIWVCFLTLEFAVKCKEYSVLRIEFVMRQCTAEPSVYYCH